MFLALVPKLYFYSNSSRTNCEDRMEIGFLLVTRGLARRHSISPIEVESGRSYACASLSKFRKLFTGFLDEAYVLHVKDSVEKGGVTHLPLYMASSLLDVGLTNQKGQQSEGIGFGSRWFSDIQSEPCRW